MVRIVRRHQARDPIARSAEARVSAHRVQMHCGQACYET